MPGHTKVALVTGASAGIGESIARRLGADGWTIAVNSRAAERAQAAVGRLAADGITAVAAPGDVADATQAEAIVAGVVAELGGLDLLVNNAGIASEAVTVELGQEDWQRIVQTNLTGSFFCSQSAYRHMSDDGGTIVNIGSLWATLGMNERAAYATSKHAIAALTETLAGAWAPRIRVVGVNPGYIATTMADSVAGGGHSDLERRTPMRRLGLASEVADVVAFLASEDAEAVNGVSWPIDGGWTAYGGW